MFRSIASVLCLSLLTALASGGGAASLVVAQTPADAAAAAGEAERSPRGALLRSLVLPGWGQAYVGAPGRGAVYFGLASGSGWMTYVARRQLRDARRQDAGLRERGELAPGERTPLVEDRAQHFEDWVALSIAFVFFAGADAFVAAYLADFDERIGVSATGDGGLRFEVRHPVGARR